MEQAEGWRELLSAILRDNQEKQRLSTELGVTSMTLNRWASGESQPRAQHLRRLLLVLPQYRKQLLASLRREFGDVFFEELADMPQEQDTLPIDLYRSVVQGYATIPEHLRFWMISRPLLSRLLEHLDPFQLGLNCIVARCMPPGGEQHQVRSLREMMAVGTPPYVSEQEEPLIFLGAESLAGHAVTAGRLGVIQDVLPDNLWFPLSQADPEMERSALACPLVRSNQVAGCLCLSSTQSHYFTPPRQELVIEYAYLLSLAFEDTAFYPYGDIALQMMPPFAIQQPILMTFRQRVVAVQIAAKRQGQSRTLLESERQVWHEIEEELLCLSPDTGWLQKAEARSLKRDDRSGEK